MLCPFVLARFLIDQINPSNRKKPKPYGNHEAA